MLRLRSLALAIPVVAALAAPAAAAATTISISGSTSIFPLAALLAKEYNREGHHVNFLYTQGGSNIGINDVAHGRVTLGASSRDPLPASDPHGLVFKRIAYDAVCVITNNSNPVGNLSQNEVQSIFSGGTSSWNGSGIPGAKASGPIQLETRTAASGTSDAFQQIFLGQNVSVAGSADQQGSNGLVQQAVHSNPLAIGYVSLAFTRGVHPVPYNGVPCTLRNAKSHVYGGVRNFWLVSRGRFRGAALAWYNWIVNNPRALAITATDWVPVK